ncbi:hypothetical protein [Embleya sp. NPDC005575]
MRFVAHVPALRAIGLASAAFQDSFAAFMTGYLLFLLPVAGVGES